jgi:hypothetical protein
VSSDCLELSSANSVTRVDRDRVRTRLNEESACASSDTEQNVSLAECWLGLSRRCLPAFVSRAVI